MTAIDDDSEDVKASEGKHVESRDKPESRRMTGWRWLGRGGIIGVVAFLLGLGLGLSVMALATPDQSRGKPSLMEASLKDARQVPYSMPIGTDHPAAGVPAPEAGVIPTPAQMKLDVIILSQKCFGSAGCVVTYRIDPTYTGSSRLTGAFTVVYRVTGGSDGPVTDYFRVDKDGTAHLSSDVIENDAQQGCNGFGCPNDANDCQ